MNPFTELSRDARLAPNLPWCQKLRAPDPIHRLAMDFKPDHVSLGDHLLTAVVNDAIMTLIVRRDYRGIHSLIGTLYDLVGPEGTGGDGRHP